MKGLRVQEYQHRRVCTGRNDLSAGVLLPDRWSVRQQACQRSYSGTLRLCP